MIANTTVLFVEFQSDDVFNNLGTSLTFKCSNSSYFNDTENGNNYCSLVRYAPYIMDYMIEIFY